MFVLIVVVLVVFRCVSFVDACLCLLAGGCLITFLVDWLEIC